MRDVLTAFGLSEKEESVLLKLIELGAQPVSVIARHSGIPRTTMYFLLEHLVQSGFVETFERGGIRFAKAIPVRSMPGMLEGHQEKMALAVDALESRLPELLKLENTLSITPTVRFMEGKKAVANMYDELAGRKQECCALFNPEALRAVLPNQYEGLATMAASSGTRVRELLVRSPEAARYRKKYASARHQIRLLPAGMTFESDTVIAGDQIFLIACSKTQVCATAIISPPLAATQFAIFETFWRLADGE